MAPRARSSGGTGPSRCTHTFFGNKIDKIHGRFVSSNEVEGYAIYHFFAQDLCLAGQDEGQLQREAQVDGDKPPPIYATMVSAPGSTVKSSSVYSPM